MPTSSAVSSKTFKGSIYYFSVVHIPEKPLFSKETIKKSTRNKKEYPSCQYNGKYFITMPPFIRKQNISSYFPVQDLIFHITTKQGMLIPIISYYILEQSFPETFTYSGRQKAS